VAHLSSVHNFLWGKCFLFPKRPPRHGVRGSGEFGAGLDEPALRCSPV
jgi:hypothetical protein